MAGPLKAHQITIRLADEQWEELRSPAAPRGTSGPEWNMRHSTLSRAQGEHEATGNAEREESVERSASTSALCEQRRIARSAPGFFGRRPGSGLSDSEGYRACPTTRPR
jgi:hypothetical protein